MQGKNFLPRTIWLTLMVIVALLIQYMLPTFTLETGLIKKWLGEETSGDEYIPMQKVDLLSDLREKPEAEQEEEVVDDNLKAQLENVAPMEEQIIIIEPNATDSSLSDSTRPLLQTPTDSTAPLNAVAPVAQPQAIKIVFNDTVKVPEGVVEIVDYGTEMGMDRFYEALNHVKERPVRIGFFGDSFIEGDILTGWLRSMMQQEWGGKGVGYIEVAPETAGFRSTVTHRHSGWMLHQWNKKSYQKKNNGLSCHYYTSKNAKAWVEGVAGKRMFGTNNFDNTVFYFKGRQKNKIRLITNDTTIEYQSGRGDSVQALMYEPGHPLQKARWEVSNYDSSSVFYGMSMDGKTGIVVDNLSMRGQSGTQLLGIPTDYLRDMHKIRKYDLIVLQFGLNVANNKCTNYGQYQRDMQRVIMHLHEAYPEAGFLVLSVGDRRYKSNGSMATMPGVKNLSMYQQKIAMETRTSYWNTLNAMLQLGGIDSMATAKPSLANMDYTHINFRGGRMLAAKLFEAIKSGKGHYDRKRNFIEEKRKEFANENK